MTWILELLRRYWKAFAIAAVLAIAAYELVDFGRQLKEQEWAQRWAQRDSDDATARATAEQKARETEKTWQVKVDQARNERDVRIQEIKDGAARIADNDSKLHSAAIKAERRACAAAVSTAGRESPGNLFADVLDSVGKRTGALATYSDELRAALNECRAAWPSLE